MDVIIKLCLSLVLLVVFLTPKNTGDSNADPSSESNFRNTEFHNVTDDVPLVFKDDSGRPLVRIKWMPHNELERNELTRSLTCPPHLHAIFLLHPENKNETYMGCYKDKIIRGSYCPEFNNEGIQPKYDALCKIASTVSICNDTYKASESYKFPKCFEIYGGIQKNEKSHKTETSDWLVVLFMKIMSVFSIIVILYIFVIGFCLRKFYYQTGTTYIQYLKDAWQCLLRIARGMDNSVPNTDNQKVIQPPKQ